MIKVRGKDLRSSKNFKILLKNIWSIKNKLLLLHILFNKWYSSLIAIVDKTEEMIGSYGPNTSPEPYEKKVSNCNLINILYFPEWPYILLYERLERRASWN